MTVLFSLGQTWLALTLQQQAGSSEPQKPTQSPGRIRLSCSWSLLTVLGPNTNFPSSHACDALGFLSNPRTQQSHQNTTR